MHVSIEDTAKPIGYGEPQRNEFFWNETFSVIHGLTRVFVKVVGSADIFRHFSPAGLKNEVIVAAMGRELLVPMPPAAEKLVDGRLALVCEWVYGPCINVVRTTSKEAMPAALVQAGEDNITRLYAMTYAANLADRHSFNLMFSREGQIVSIDHEYSLSDEVDHGAGFRTISNPFSNLMYLHGSLTLPLDFRLDGSALKDFAARAPTAAKILRDADRGEEADAFEHRVALVERVSRRTPVTTGDFLRAAMNHKP